MNICIHCKLEIDLDRLEFLQEFNKPLTCKKCSMEQPVAGYKDKPRIVKSKTDAQLKKVKDKYEEVKQANIDFAKRELKAYTNFWKEVSKKRKNKRKHNGRKTN